MTPEPTPGPRKYRSTLRTRQAEQTRRDILAAAVHLFARNGWARTTLAAVAEDAGVAVETVYSGFGSKKALLRAAADVAIVGDADPVPLAEREIFTRLRTEPPARRLTSMIEFVGTTYGGPIHRLWSALLEAASGDPEVAQWCTELEKGRRTSLAQALELIYERKRTERVVDILWAVLSIETFSKLRLERGWTIEQWQDWAVETVRLFAGDP